MKKKIIIALSIVIILLLSIVSYFYITKMLIFIVPGSADEIIDIGELKMYVVCDRWDTAKIYSEMDEKVVIDNYECSLISPVSFDGSCRIVYKKDEQSVLNYSIKGATKLGKITISDLASSYLFNCKYKTE